jgi:DNA-binding PadR family transcriptional regulator
MRTHANDRLKGTLDLLVLKILASHGRMHGYGITLRIEQVSENVLRLERSIERSRTDEVTPVLRKIQDKGSPVTDRTFTCNQPQTRKRSVCHQVWKG